MSAGRNEQRLNPRHWYIGSDGQPLVSAATLLMLHLPRRGDEPVNVARGWHPRPPHLVIR